MAMPVKFVNGDTRRACVNCAAAKTKCVSSSSSSSSCDRCLLLKKTCELRPDNSTNKKRKRRNAQAVLAEKVDEIVALLKVNPSQGDSITIPERSAPAATPSAFYSFPGLTVDVDEAEELLHHFQQHQAALVPYIEIPATTTASQLHDERPLLFLAVMTAASHYDAQRQEAFFKASIAWLADHVLIQGQKNLGLFQGMLLLLGWFHTQIYVNPQITNLLHLCMAMSVDLGLNQSTPPVTEFKTGPSLLDGPRRVVHGPGPYPQTRTLEERRAYAGCYYLSTVVASSFTVSTELPWTVQLEEACAALSSSGIASDLRLAKLVELQRIISEVNQTRKDIAASGHAGVIPLSVYITPFEARLRQLWDDTPEEVRQDTCLQLSHHTAKMALYQVSLPPTTPSPSSSLPTSTSISITSTRVLCLQSALAGMELHLSVPPSRLYDMPLPFFAHTGQILTTLARIRLCVPPRVDPQNPLHFDLAHVIERSAAHLELAGTGSGRPGTNERLWRWAGWLRRCAAALGRGDAARLEVRLGDVGRRDGRGVGAVVAACRTGGEGGAVCGGYGLQGGVGVSQEVGAGGGGGGGYMTPSSCLDVGGVVEGTNPDVVGMQQEGGGIPMEWSAFLDDMSGFGLFGLSEDLLLQDMFAGGGTADGNGAVVGD